MPRVSSRAFSQPELLVALLVITVVTALGLSQVGKTTARAKARQDEQRIAELNAACRRFHEQRGCWPDRNLVYLTYYGYAQPSTTGYPYHQYTPYGGIYRFDPQRCEVHR